MKTEKFDLLNEFFIRWRMGASISRIVEELKVEGKNEKDIFECKKLFERWMNSKNRDWKNLRKLAK